MQKEKVNQTYSNSNVGGPRWWWIPWYKSVKRTPNKNKSKNGYGILKGDPNHLPYNFQHDSYKTNTTLPCKCEALDIPWTWTQPFVRSHFSPKTIIQTLIVEAADFFFKCPDTSTHKKCHFLGKLVVSCTFRGKIIQHQPQHFMHKIFEDKSMKFATNF